LIVTDALDMSGLTIYFNQDEAAVRAIEAGADILVKPSDTDAVVRGLIRAVKTGRIAESRIDLSVRRILAAKYDLGIVSKRTTPLDQIDKLLSGPPVAAFAKEVAEHAITLVRDNARTIPLNLPANKKIVNFVITNGDDRRFIALPFIEEMAHLGRPMSTVVLDGRSSEEEIREAIKEASSADFIIASLYGRVRAGEAGSAGLPENPAAALTKLIQGKTPVVGISFGNPYLLSGFPGLQTYVVAYGDMPSLQQATACALLGQIGISGRLPISLPPLYPRGTGIQVKRKKASDNTLR
jgi:beta-N-acetylhexosaminidase